MEYTSKLSKPPISSLRWDQGVTTTFNKSDQFESFFRLTRFRNSGDQMGTFLVFQRDVHNRFVGRYFRHRISCSLWVNFFYQLMKMVAVILNQVVRVDLESAEPNESADSIYCNFHGVQNQSNGSLCWKEQKHLASDLI